MTRGISAESIKAIIEDWSPNDRVKVYDKIITQCTELNPWMPIESAPKDRQIVLSYPELGVHDGCWIVDSWYCELSDLTQSKEHPTQWCELPDDPK